MKAGLKGLRILVVAAVVIIGSVTAVSVPARAEAAGPCGGGYSLVGHYPVRLYSGISKEWQTRLGAPGSVVGYLDVYWNSSAKKNCAVGSYAGKAYGKALLSQVHIAAGSSARDTDRGTYRYYAGPVYTTAQRSGQCINAYFGLFPKENSPALAGRSLTSAHCG